jgi:mannose-6-phosphate isomerase-like protein (cupin superfamily)
MTMVVEGVATVLSGEAETCARRTVGPGFALVEPGGSGTEIRNEGHSPLYLYTATFTVAGPSPTALAAEPCAATPSRLATVATLDRVVIEAPLSVESKGLSDVYLGAVRLAPQGTVGWHVQHRPLLAAVGQGKVTLDLALSEGCRTGIFPAETGFLEPAQTVHQLRNETSSPAMYYYLAFAASPQPFIAPSPPPRQCEGS